MAEAQMHEIPVAPALASLAPPNRLLTLSRVATLLVFVIAAACYIAFSLH